MIGLNVVALSQVSDGAGQFQDAVVGTSREVELLHGRLQQLFGGRLDLTKLAYFGWSHVGIAGDFRAFEPLQLAFSSGLHTLTNGFRILDLPFIGQLLIIHAGNLDMDINAVEQRTADALLVARDGGS